MTTEAWENNIYDYKDIGLPVRELCYILLIDLLWIKLIKTWLHNISIACHDILATQNPATLYMSSYLRNKNIN